MSIYINGLGEIKLTKSKAKLSGIKRNDRIVASFFLDEYIRICKEWNHPICKKYFMDFEILIKEHLQEQFKKEFGEY